MDTHRGAERTTRSSRVPLLKDGDHLTVEEFERRYEAMPHLKKAELIQGVVYMPSPVRYEDHGQQHFDLITWAGYYRTFSHGIEGGDNTTLRLPLGVNEPQPDAFLRISPLHGGQSLTSSDGYVVGAPEWVGEISASSASYDLHQKLDAYQLNGVQEYLVWRVEDRAIDWLVLRDRKFQPLKGRGGVFRFRVLPGLHLDVAAVLRGDMPKVLSVLDLGVRSDVHDRFVARLARNHRNASLHS
jgi:Uma2 family endonuclease